ncbi:receptor-interacting serine/threonine-protein kinase 1-like [Gigantopelta aegis]|uniref:receptor-interacting serine/threonine-protein kinase 1-like n=1 Tax=Gigantopelta aegis TaxID=1735272 RepID=UPI001B88E287|nr:receptor-interacting serine/threonine-protein kinase 1-like [Gigantopelta aegis]
MSCCSMNQKNQGPVYYVPNLTFSMDLKLDPDDGSKSNNSGGTPIIQNNLEIKDSILQIGYNNLVHMHYHGIVEPDLSSDSDEEEDDCDQDSDQRKAADDLKQSTRTITEEDLRNLSHQIGGSWRRFLRKLGIDDADMDHECENSRSGGTPEVIYRLLLRWKKDSVDPSVSTIACALEESNLKPLLKNLQP